jgi:hypothetical protein
VRDSCSSQKLITQPKAFHIQIISAILDGLMITAGFGKIIAKYGSAFYQDSFKIKKIPKESANPYFLTLWAP